ncbi:MAG: DUF3015 family protein [Oligoflexales bacterium]|nr:DUF3015 family protein [Oligoflexales bacterium]
MNLVKPNSLVIVFILLFSASAQGRNYKMAGCGLGSQVIKDDGIIQVAAATTNATSGSQTFGITSGTSNCVAANQQAKINQQEAFFVANYSALAKEVAQGDGAALRALSAQLGCQESVYGQFKDAMQYNYQEIFSAPGAITALNRAKYFVKAERSIANNCADLI